MNQDLPEIRPPLWRLVFDNVRQDRIPLRASALSFQTLTSLLPMLAIALALLSMPAFLEQREQLLDRLVSLLVPEDFEAAVASSQPQFEGSQDPTQEQARWSHIRARFHRVSERMAGNLSSISIFSFCALVVIAGLLYHTVDETFNAIWKVSAGRPFFMKVAITSAFIFWGPLVLVLSVSLTGRLGDWPILSGYVIPVLLSAMAFTAFYMTMPHARVRLDAALLGGCVGALLWELSKVGFLYYVVHVAGLSKLYGSLGLVPVLFGWVYLSWLVVLAGAELAYIAQHHRAIVEQWEAKQKRTRTLDSVVDGVQRDAALIPPLSMAVAIEIARRFRANANPGGTRLSDLAESLDAESGPLARALERLVAGGFVAPVYAASTASSFRALGLSRAIGRIVTGGVLAHEKDGESSLSEADPRYLPTRDLAQCKVVELAKACHGARPLTGRGPSWEKALEVLGRLEREGELPLAALTLADLVPAPPAPALDPKAQPFNPSTP